MKIIRKEKSLNKIFVFIEIFNSILQYKSIFYFSRQIIKTIYTIKIVCFSDIG